MLKHMLRLAVLIASAGCFGDRLVVVKFPFDAYNRGKRDAVQFVIEAKDVGPVITKNSSSQFSADVAVGREYGTVTGPRDQRYSADVSVSIRDTKTGALFIGPVRCYIDKSWQVNTLVYELDSFGNERLRCGWY